MRELLALMPACLCLIPENVTAPVMENCKWSSWLNTDNPVQRDKYSDYEADDERFETITKRGIALCRSEPAAIQCWDNQLSVEVPNGPLCNATVGLYCDWLCSDYSIRVACCEDAALDRDIRFDYADEEGTTVAVMTPVEKTITNPTPVLAGMNSATGSTVGVFLIALLCV